MKILLFHSLKDTLGTAELTLPSTTPIHPPELWSQLILQHPKLQPFQKTTRVACNHSYVTEATLLHPEDEIALIPPVSGG
jgi:molybdopterin converting factor subunit 1